MLAVATVLLNAATTGDHLLRSLWHRHLWAVAGMDTLLLIGGVAAALTARRLARGELDSALHTFLLAPRPVASETRSTRK